jgi:hypothetical protein
VISKLPQQIAVHAVKMELRYGFLMKNSRHPSLSSTLSGVFRGQLSLQVGDSSISNITTIDSGIIEVRRYGRGTR